jgi:hypothetical protein
VAELAAGDVGSQLRLAGGVQGRVQPERRQAVAAACVVRQAQHRALGGGRIEAELVRRRAAGSARREQRCIGILRRSSRGDESRREERAEENG